MRFILHWLVSSIAIMIAAYLTSASVENFSAALVAALVLGLINAFIKPILFIITLPINIVTLGLFTLVLNASMILLTDAIVPGFEVGGFWRAFFFAIILACLQYALNQITREEDAKMYFRSRW